jgi:trehalose 6-phosphate phosphatase
MIDSEPLEFLTKISAQNSKYALFLDVDGTLLDIAETPDAVAIPPGLVASLAAAERKLTGAVALVSGRPIEELDRLFSPLRLRASGVHGAQMRFDPRAAPQPSPLAARLPTSLWAALAELLAQFPGTMAENKGFSFAIHYRQVPEIGPQLREALEHLLIMEDAGEIEIINARRGFELKRPDCNKGKAIDLFLQHAPFAGRSPIFIGDDDTDEAGFAAVAAHGGQGFSVGLRRAGVTDVFENPLEVRAWLTAFADEGERV